MPLNLTANEKNVFAAIVENPKFQRRKLSTIVKKSGLTVEEVRAVLSNPAHAPYLDIPASQAETLAQFERDYAQFETDLAAFNAPPSAVEHAVATVAEPLLPEDNEADEDEAEGAPAEPQAPVAPVRPDEFFGFRFQVFYILCQ